MCVAVALPATVMSMRSRQLGLHQLGWGLQSALLL
jgi:hypothetical protein